MIPTWLSLVDVTFVAVALLFAWHGFRNGFAVHIAHVLTFVVMGSFLFFVYPYLFNYLDGVFHNLDETYLMWLLLAGMAVLTLVVFMWLNRLFASMLKKRVSPRSDHIYGFILGFIRGVFVALFAMIFLVILGPPRIYDDFRIKSHVGKLVCYELVPRIQPHLTHAVLEEQVQKLKNKLLEREEAGDLE